MTKFKVAIVVGSNRRESINRKLGQAIAKLADAHVVTKFVQIDDLPIYNQDLEKPLPANVERFKAELETADALLFVTPEHNRSIPAALKNAIDWGARPHGRNCWAGKINRDYGDFSRCDWHRHRPAASASDSGRPRRPRHGRRGLYHLQARTDRRCQHHNRRWRSPVSASLRGSVRGIARPPQRP
jgi:NAD(P)H-dependent FMN reductase